MATERCEDLLKQVIDHFNKEDEFVRFMQIRQWKRLKYYWNGFTKLWWSTTAHDWRVADRLDDGQQDSYDKPVNIYRAYLESIIAALSTQVPGLKCIPDDADNSLDLSTAKAGDKIAELVYKHNDVMLLWIHALFILCTEGAVFAYNETIEDESFGTYQQKNYESSTEKGTNSSCPDCGALIDNYAVTEEGDWNCPTCNSQMLPQQNEQEVEISKFVGITSKPKSRQRIRAFGGLNVMVPNYAREQKDIPALRFCDDYHYSVLREKYPDLKYKFTKQSEINAGVQSGDMYEKWARTSTQYFGYFPINTATETLWWLRTCAFQVLEDKDDIVYLKKKFPDGCKVAMVNDEFCEATPESLDDHWTITNNPLSDFIHFDPLGLLLTSIQDITNDLISLTLQTIEHGIPQTFADPTVLDFNKYKQTEVAPGTIFPAKGSAGKKISDGFYEVKTAALSSEVLPFGEKIEQLGELVSGAQPQLSGANADPGNSRTMGEYSMRKSQALQRLQTTWKMFNFWWKNIFGKVIPAYIKEVQDDEKLVKQDSLGNFVNILISKAELQGKIGDVELETADEIPMSIGEQRDMVMNLMKLGNPEIIAALGSGNNLQLLAKIIGIDDFEIPGNDDRQKQYEEIQLLVMSQPIQDGMGNMNPSIDVDPLVDNHNVEAEICRDWAVSDVGRYAKMKVPQGYQNVLLHMQHHMNLAQQAAATEGKTQAPKVNLSIASQLTNSQIVAVLGKEGIEIPPPSPQEMEQQQAKPQVKNNGN